MKHAAKPYRWFLQEREWELGDFIMVTPLLRALHTAWGHKVPVYFETAYVGNLFSSCYFIDRLESRPTDTEPFWDTKSPRSLMRSMDDSDYLAHFNCGLPPYLRALYLFNDFQPWCDPCTSETPEGYIPAKKPVAVFLGCLAERLLEDKSIHPRIVAKSLLALIARDCTPVLLGSESDHRLWKPVFRELAYPVSLNMVNLIGKLTIRQSVAVLSHCEGFISNDTGLYHVAAALHLKGIVLWNTTCFERNKCPSLSVTHSRHPLAHFSDVQHWINALPCNQFQTT